MMRIKPTLITVPATVSKKDITDRIVYYTRKVAERSSYPSSKKLPRAYKFRSQRLMAYKELMHQIILEGELPECPLENR
jgi:hypothetical protein